MDLRTLNRFVYALTGEADSRRPIVAEVNGERLRVSEVRCTDTYELRLVLTPEPSNRESKSC